MEIKNSDDEKFEIKFSHQAKIMLENMEKFDKKSFEKWFLSNLTIGSNNILMFLLEGKNKSGEQENVG